MAVAGRAELERIAAEHGVRVVSNAIRIRCPVHLGKTKSLTIKVFGDGFLLAKCWGGGCDRLDVNKALGIGVSKDPPPRCGVGGCRSGLDSRAAVYENPTVEGGRICSHREDVLAGLDCWRPDCHSAEPHKHVWGRGAHSGALLLAWGADGPDSAAVLVEGEKAASMLAGHTETEPYTAFSWRGGAGSVSAGDWSVLEGRRVVVWPDADAEGRVAGDVAVLKSFGSGALDVRLVDVSGLGDKQDAADLDAAAAIRLLKSAVPQARPAPPTPANGATPTPDHRYPMHTTGFDLNKDLGLVWREMLARNATPDGHHVYRRAATPVVVASWQDGPERRAKVEDLDGETVLLESSRAVFWHSLSGGSPSPAIPPKRLGGLLLKTSPDTLPELDRAVQWPLLTPTGFVQRSGYDADSKAYLQLPLSLDCDMPIAAALSVWDELVCDFPFEEQSDRAAALACAITPLVRPVAPLAPLACFLKPESQTGATLLALVTASICEGAPPPIRPPLSWDRDESAKQLTTYTNESLCWVLIDNQEKLDNPGLASMLTAQAFAGRKLGTNESLEVSNSRFQVMVTSNNLSMTKELMNRVYAIRLDARVPNPGDRTGFVHADLLAYARENRVRLLGALSSLVKAWDLAGRPAGPSIQSLGGFAGWRDAVSGILHHAGVGSFLANISDVRSRVQGDHLDGQAFVSSWFETYQNSHVGVKELHAVALPEDGEPLLRLRGADRVGPQGQKVRLGEWLVRNSRRRFYGPEGTLLKISPAGTHKRARQYELITETTSPHVQPKAQNTPPPETRGCPICGRNVDDALKDEFGQCLNLDDCERTRAENESNDQTRTRLESEESQPGLELPANRTH